MSQDKPLYNNKKQSLVSESLDLILINDACNTFEFVIESLIEVCKHEPEQAEQCTLTAHFKGSCNINSGTFNELKPQHDHLAQRGLSVMIC